MASRPEYQHQSRSPPALSSRPPNSSPSSSSSTTDSSSKQAPEASTDGGRSHEEGPKEHATVTVRFRPLSPRETRQGEGIAWYADGDAAVRSEQDPSVAYAYDRVFGPTTTTHHVYDVAAQHVVAGAMKGINGTIFAYGVTSSGKTHTMHGDQRSPGIIPLAVKDAFNIIQETPSREFLLRVSYLEIYNEVVNDLLNPAGQNLRIREDLQGTSVEGIKEEVVVSPVHALSLIAAGEEHRHVGSNNLNLLSSRSHTIFALIIESSPCGRCCENEAVNLSQLNLIDLAGSESSRAETTGVRQKEGSYINKSLLTLRTVIAKLSDGKGTHIPYRDCKLTRLLQSSLSGQGHVSLICTVTPSSSNSEETHNTLKFAHRAKQIEIQASQNKIPDEKSLIKKYQNEIQSLKEELEQLQRGMVNAGAPKDIRGDDLVLLKRKLEDGHVKLQSRLEQEEEEAKAVLLERIQCLTKLILVSTKATQSPRFSQQPGPRRRYSFREEELAYLPYKRRDMDMVLDDESCNILVPVEGYDETIDHNSRDKHRKHGLLNWFKIWRRESGASMLTNSDDKSSGRESLATPSTPQAESVDFPADSRISISLTAESIPAGSLLNEHDRELPTDNLYLQQTPKIYMKKIEDEIRMKNQQIASLEKQMADSISTSHSAIDKPGLSLSYDELLEQLNGMSFELEVKTADNRIIQDRLQQKICEREELRDAVASLKQQLALALDTKSSCLSAKPQHMNKENLLSRDVTAELLQQAHMASEIEGLKQRVEQLSESKSQLEGRNRKLAEEGAYAKGLASAAGVELKALSEEVTKLMKDNERLASELASARNAPIGRKGPALAKRETKPRYHERVMVLEAALVEKEQREAELRKKVQSSKQKEAFLENELANVRVLVEKLKKSNGKSELDSSDSSNENGIYRRI